MKKFTALFTAILLSCATLFTAVSANAAEVDYMSLSEEAPAYETENETESETYDSFPESYSSRDLNHCTSVKNQIGNVCWAYASISSYETLQLKYHFFTSDLSTEALDLWGTIEENGEGWQRDELEAGYSYIPIGYFTSWSGPVTEEENAYPRYGVTKLRYLSRFRPTEIKQAIYNDGAVTANLNIFNRAYSSDKCSYCLTDQISSMSGHTVSVVGWDDNYPKEKFNGNYTPKNNGAWLCKNSWGNNNAIGGYLWISYEDYYLFNDEFLPPSFACDYIRTIADEDSIYQNEKYGATYSFTTNSADVTDYINVFDFSEKGNVIDDVVFESRAKGATYKVYYVPVDDNGIPVEEKNRWTEISGGTIDYEGYICAEVDDFTVSKRKAGIAVEIDTTALNKNAASDDEKVKNCIGVTEWLRNRTSKKMIFLKPCEKGHSFVSTENGFVDLSDYYISQGDEYGGGTLVIKAITNATKDTNLIGDVDLDGKINILDATLIQKYIVAEKTDLSGDQLINADFNKDGEININDVTAIQKHIALTTEE